MRLLCWSVGGRLGAAAGKQIDAVLGNAPDVLALQGISKGNHPDWHAALTGAGYSVLSALELLDAPYPEMAPPIRRRYCSLTAARGSIAPLPGLTFEDPAEAATAFPEQYLAALVELPGESPVELHNTEVPPGETLGVIKMQALAAIRRRIDSSPERPRVLCGDFKAPHAEDEDGITVWTAGHPKLREQWEAAERSLLADPNLRDAYRECREPGTPLPVSYLTRGTRHRYDHVLASRDLDVIACRYLSDWRTRKLSEHSPVEAELANSKRRSEAG
ncbi:MAG: hypothetical protein ACR2GL_00650 [Thermoleophilaceae bacterium]